MEVTGSTNIKSFNKGQSYQALKAKHFDLKDRNKKGISKNKELEKLNKSFYCDYVYDHMDEHYEELEQSIQEYNKRPSQVDHKSRRHKNLADYIEKRRSRKNINKDFHGLEYMMVSKVGSMESWQQVLKEFEKHGVNEEDTLNCLNDAFKEYFDDFNDSYGAYGIIMVQADTNLDEMGAPHMHSRILLDNKLENGLPDTNLSNALKEKYGKASNKELMEKFRFDLDNSLIDKSSEALKDLAHERNFEFEGLEMIRLEAEEVGLTHNAYKQKKERERQQKELDEREKQIQAQEKEIQSQKQELAQRSKALDTREASISSREALLDKRDDELSLKEYDVLKKHERESEALKEIEDTLKNTKSVFDFGNVYVESLKKRFYEFDTDLVDYVSQPFYEKAPKSYNTIQKRAAKYKENVDLGTITKERNQQAKKIHKTEEDYMRLANQMVSQIQDDNEQDKDYEL